MQLPGSLRFGFRFHGAKTEVKTGRAPDWLVGAIMLALLEVLALSTLCPGWRCVHQVPRDMPDAWCGLVLTGLVVIMLALFGVLAPRALRSGWHCMYQVPRENA